jgi:hypothetical protein
MPNETSLDSFVLRFMQETRPGEQARRTPAWHGIIRHVQSNTERHFTRWTEASAFIAEFVDLWEESADP